MSEGYTLPDGIIWIEPGRLSCSKCGREELVRGANFEHLAFFRNHEKCAKNFGARPASSMSIREKFALDIAVVLVQYKSDGPETIAQEAVDVADRLLQELQVISRPSQAWSEDEIKDIHKAALERLDRIGNRRS